MGDRPPGAVPAECHTVPDRRRGPGGAGGQRVAPGRHSAAPAPCCSASFLTFTAPLTLQEKIAKTYGSFKVMYTVGYSVSLCALLLALAVLLGFRWAQTGAAPGGALGERTLTAAPCLPSKLHCMRNYIHMNLFASFIVKGVSVLVIDALLKTHYSDKIDDYNVRIWLSDEVSGGQGVGGDGPRQALTPTCRLPLAAGRPRSSCSMASWPTTAGCWWRASTCTTCWWWLFSLRGATSPSTCASAGVSAACIPFPSHPIPEPTPCLTCPTPCFHSRGTCAISHPMGRCEVSL